MVNFKWNKLPPLHIVDRYFNAVHNLGVKNDGDGLDYYLPGAKFDEDVLRIKGPYVVLVLGAAHFTKQIPTELAAEICAGSEWPVVLIGGKQEMDKAAFIENASPSSIINKVGVLSIHESAFLIRDSRLVISSDTGMMHIAAAFKKELIVVWGNTIPAIWYGALLWKLRG